MSDILVKIGADITDFSRKMAESQKKLTEFNNKNKETFDAFKKTGAAITTFGATTAVALGGAVKTAVDFESAFAGVNSLPSSLVMAG